MKVITLEEEFERNPELKKNDLEYIKSWLAKQDHLPSVVPDKLLVALLHSCYYQLEFTKQVLDNYFSVRTHAPEIFANRDLSRKDVLDAFHTMYFIPLRKTTPEGYRVVLCRLARTDPSVYIFSDAMKIFTMITDAWLNIKGTDKGVIIVIDMSGICFGHVKRLIISVIRKIMFYLQEAMPIRLKGFHYINLVPFMDAIMSLVKPFMNKELLNMLQFHNEMETLYKVIPQEILPNEYGGKGGSFEELQNECRDYINESQAYFEEIDNLKVIEDRRLAKDRKVSELFGVEGSFKQLVID